MTAAGECRVCCARGRSTKHAQPLMPAACEISAIQKTTGDVLGVKGRGSGRDGGDDFGMKLGEGGRNRREISNGRNRYSNIFNEGALCSLLLDVLLADLGLALDDGATAGFGLAGRGDGCEVRNDPSCDETKGQQEDKAEDVPVFCAEARQQRTPIHCPTRQPAGIKKSGVIGRLDWENYDFLTTITQLPPRRQAKYGKFFCVGRPCFYRSAALETKKSPHERTEKRAARQRAAPVPLSCVPA